MGSRFCWCRRSPSPLPHPQSPHPSSSRCPLEALECRQAWVEETGLVLGYSIMRLQANLCDHVRNTKIYVRLSREGDWSTWHPMDCLPPPHLPTMAADCWDAGMIHRQMATRHSATRQFATRLPATETFCNSDILPPRHFATPTFCHSDNLPPRHFATPTFCNPPDFLPPRLSATSDFLQPDFLQPPTFCNQTFRHSDNLPPRHFPTLQKRDNLQPQQFATATNCNRDNLQPRQFATLKK